MFEPKLDSHRFAFQRVGGQVYCGPATTPIGFQNSAMGVTSGSHGTVLVGSLQIVESSMM
jgi:hypothetical protein